MNESRESTPTQRTSGGRFAWAMKPLLLAFIAIGSFILGQYTTPSATDARSLRDLASSVAELESRIEKHTQDFDNFKNGLLVGEGPQVADPTGGGSGAPPELPEVAYRMENDPLAMGPVDAPVVMVMYSDFRCPYCAKFHTEAKPDLVERYVEPGLLRIEWRDFPIFGESSMVAARAGRAAANQGMFWEFTKAVYDAAPQSGHPNLTPEVLKGFAEEIGVPDVERFASEMNGDGFENEIEEHLTQGTQIGVTGTPAFVINGEPVMGAQPVDVFTGVIDAALEAANE